MRITKTTNFRKTTATTLLLSLLVPAISAAGQFNALYAGASEAEKSAYETWLQFYPDLNSQISEAFDVSNAEGNFVFSSNKLPVAWDVNARLDIKVDSINVGYFLSLRNPSNGQLLFPGLTVESQNVQISAGHDLIVSPIPAEEGFGYALSVGYKQKAVLSADNKIILKEPGIGMVSSYYDKISIGLQDYAEATLNARQILLYGGIEAQYGSSLQLTASEGIYILNGHEKALGASAPIRLTDAKMEADAPNIFVNHEIQIGQNILGYNLKGFLYIGQQDGRTRN